MSELLDQLVEAARKRGEGTANSVAGTIKIDKTDPLLDGADEAIRSLFEFNKKSAKKRRAKTR